MKKCFTPKVKIRKVMKICSMQALIAMTLCSLAFAYDNHAQVLDKKITIKLKDVSFEEALDAIEELTDIKFFYSVDQLGIREKISFEAVDRSLRDLLDELLAPYRIRYKVHERKSTITLKKQYEEQESPPKERNGEQVAVTRSLSVATVTGTVTDAATKLPIAGVNIIIKGTTDGTTTDSEGTYSIWAEENDILVFSFIGYATFETQVSGRMEIDVVLQEDTKSLKEVVINAGYWQVTKREQTGNISRVTAKDIDKQPVPNALMAIQARMPGVVITQTSGVPGSGMKIQIRGQNSLRTLDPSSGVNGNAPLYVIDGVPISSSPVLSYGELLSVSAGGIDPLNNINPNNIASIEILKDADATAIYGSRGANGVILITTKKGKSGTTDIDIQAYTSAGQVTKMMDVMNTEQYLAMRNEAFANDGATPGASDYDLNGAWDQTSDTDWQELLIGGRATISDVQTSISGGSENTSFRFGGGFHQEGTVFPGDFGYKKATGFLNFNHTIPSQKLTVGLSVNYGQDNHDLFNWNVASYALKLPPNAPLYDEAGNLDWIGYSSTGGDNANPLSYFETSHNSKTGNLISSSVLSYELIKGLRIVANLGYNDTQTDQVITRPRSSLNPASSTPSGTTIMKSSSKNWIAEPQLVYSKKVGNGKLDVLIGTTWQSNSATRLIMTGQGYVSDGLLGNIQAASSISITDDSESEYRYNAVFGRVGYIWMDKYLLNLTARRDGSSRFGADKQFGNFGAVGVGWIFSEEEFVKNNLSFLSFSKLRASYGTTGSDQIGNYGYLGTYSPASATYRGAPILNTTGLANPDFAWEVNKKLEAALDFGFLQNRIRLSTRWYRNRSSNQLVGYPLPATTGFTLVQYNLDATVENTGWEFELNTINLDGSNFKWTTAVNLTIPRNKLVSYPNLEGSSYANRYMVGEPLTISKRYEYIGVDPETGLYQVTDLDESGSFNNADRQTVIDLSRKYYGGLQNTFSYGSFDLNFSLELVKQKASDYLSVFSIQPGRRSNQLVSILKKDRWTQDGDEAELQKFTQVSSSNYSRAASSDLSLTDASYVRLKTISISYNFPTTLLKRIKMKEARIYVQAQNLFTVSDYFGFNPESPYLELPPLRVIGGGIQLKL